MPCVAKKFEAQRPEFTSGGVLDVDAVLTTVKPPRCSKKPPSILAYYVIKEFNDLAENRGIAGQIELNGTFCLEKCDNGVSVNVNDEIITGVAPEKAGEIFRNQISILVDKN